MLEKFFLQISTSKRLFNFLNANVPHAADGVPVNHVQCRVTSLLLPMLCSLPQSENNRMLTAVDLTATGVTVNKQFLKVTYSPFKSSHLRSCNQQMFGILLKKLLKRRFVNQNS